MKRCSWVNEKNELYLKYHDTEWGIPNYDDTYLYEMLLLETFQAGLSWECILNKRESFRKAFDNFNYKKIVNYDERKIKSLIANKNIIRNIQKEYGSFSNYIWHFTNNKQIINSSNQIKTTSPLSDEISKDLKKRGMKFVGSTIIYSYLQAIGIINDHEPNCFLAKKSYNEATKQKQNRI